MHSGIRTARSVYMDVLHSNVLEHMLDLALNSPLPWLDLPAAEIRPVIFNSDQNILTHKYQVW